MNVTTDSTTNLDHPQRKSDHSCIPDQYTTQYGSSKPHNNVQDGQDTHIDAGVHSYPQSQHMPTAYIFMIYSFYLPIPDCFPQINFGTTPYSDLRPFTFMYNTNLPTELNTYIHSALFYCPSVSLFNDWVRTLVYHLQNSGLKDLVPDAHDLTMRGPTPVEMLCFISLFFFTMYHNKVIQNGPTNVLKGKCVHMISYVKIWRFTRRKTI